MERSVEQRYRDGRYAGENPDWHESDAAWKADHIASILDSNGMLEGARSICDIGCGTGGVLESLGQRVADGVALVGFEPSPQALEQAQRLRSRRVEIRPMDGLAELGAGWDVALVLDVFEHVPDYLGFLEAARGVAASFVFHIPLDMNVQMVARRSAIPRTRESIGHLHYFSYDSALATLADCGYRVIDSRLTVGTVDLPPSGRARLLRPFRRLAFKLAPVAAARFMGGASLLALAAPETG